MPPSQTPAITPAQFTTFGALLRFLRRRAGLTQLELSIAVGYSESQISRLEQNERVPDAAMLAARFVPALGLEQEPQWVARLLELGGALSAAAPEQVELKPSIILPQGAIISPNNLPLQLSSFVGREPETAELTQLFARWRLVTLTGAGGMGKTRLALQVSRALVERYDDGAWLVDLSALAEPTLVPQRVASVFGLRDEPGRSFTDTLAHYLKPKTLFLVLDNCEHLIAACAQLAEALLQTCPNLRILATSREALGIAGERSFVVPSLTVPDHVGLPSSDEQFLETLMDYDAVRLFIERAQGVLPQFRLTQENAHAVAQVCQRLDGIPLAIELAVARLRILSVVQIAARLDHCFQLLTGGTRTALPRHQTLETLIDWSYDLLTEPEQILLRRLAVFAGGWTLEAAEIVCGGSGIVPTQAMDLLGKLVVKSMVLVEQNGTERYRMLETIRQYARAKLEASGEADAVRYKHVEYFLALTASSRVRLSDRAPQWLLPLVPEMDNLHAGLIWTLPRVNGAEASLHLANTIGWDSNMRSYWSDGGDFLRKALAHPDASSYPQAQMWDLALLAEMVASPGNFSEAREYLNQSLVLSERIQDLWYKGHILHRLGWLAREQDDAKTARAQLKESIQIFTQLGDKWSVGWVELTLGEVAVMEEDTTGAMALLIQSLQVMKQYQEAWGLGWAYNHLGHVAQLEGKYERARELHQSSIPYFHELGMRSGLAWAEQSQGEIALAENDAETARTRLLQAFGSFREIGDRAGLSWCLSGLAGVAALDEEPECAAFLWGSAEALRQSIGTRHAPASRATRERLMALARQQLGSGAFEAAWKKGATTPLEQAIQEALSL